MGWMHDTLQYLRRDPIHRCHHQNELSFRAVYADSENFVLPLSHDEVVHGKRSLLSQMPGDEWQRFANLRLLYSYQYATPGKKMLFMGGELGQWTEWNHDAEIDWSLKDGVHHAGITRLVSDLNRLYRNESPLHQRDCEADGFQWISADDWEKSTFAFIRWSENNDEWMIIVLNFTPIARDEYRIGVPRRGFYREAFNSDASEYGGSGSGNTAGVYSAPDSMHGFDDSLTLTLPPLAMIALKPVRAS